MAKFFSLLDLAKKEKSDAVVGLIEEIGLTAPEVTQIDSRVISGTSFKTFVRTGVPRIGFRSPNTPVTNAISQYEERNVELFNMSGSVFVDDAILAASIDGPEYVKALETSGVMQGALISAGVQAFYGHAVDEDGFPGLRDFIDDGMIISADPSKGAGYAGEEGTSVYAIIEGARGVQWIYGRGQTISLGAWRKKDFTVMKENGEIGHIPGEGADMNCWLAIVNNSKLTAARLKNIGDAEGTMLTDDKLADTLALFPAGSRVTKFIMNSKAVNQLRKSRQVVAVSSNGGSVGGGSAGFAPMPTESNGIPILVTDSIVNDESDLSAIKGITHWNYKVKNA